MNSALEQDPSTRRELTVRAVLTGVLIGALLTPCNIYSGLKIGWTFNMSITALLLAFAFWTPLARGFGRQRWGQCARWNLYESNINQTAASAAASIISGGLVAPIPAYLLLTGNTLHWPAMSAWVFSVSFLGVWVAWYLRPLLIGPGGLVFPAGIATAETLREMFNSGREATIRLIALLGALITAAGIKLVDAWWWALPRSAFGGQYGRLGFGLDPSLLMFGFGAIIGIRAGLSLLLGAVLAWGVLAPWLIDSGRIAQTALVGENWFQPLVGWLIWPGVSLMVAASLTSFVAGLRPIRLRGGNWPRPARWPLLGLLVASVFALVLQHVLFGIAWWMALLAVPLAFALAAVAARVVGETGIPPIGAIGKVSQLSFGVLAPGQPITNLMTANVAGGAAGQCADLLNDFKTGAEIGAVPGRQVLAQCLGILVGSVVGSVVYLQMIPHPTAQLLSAEWPAPAVAVWKAVAEALSGGLHSVPADARWAMAIAAVIGILLGLAERFGGRRARYLPSGATVGLAFVIPASTAITLFAGAALAYALRRTAPAWSARFLYVIAAGLIAGESLFGVFVAIAGLR